MSAPTGQTYTAKVNGPDAPMKGDPGVTSVSLKMIGTNTLEETDKRNGKVISVFKLTVASDGKTAKAVAEDKLQNRTTEFAVDEAVDCGVGMGRALLALCDIGPQRLKPHCKRDFRGTAEAVPL